MGKYHESLAIFEKARTLDPENNDALYHLAASQLALEMYPEAVNSYSNLLTGDS